MKITEFFPEISSFKHNLIFTNIEKPWDVFSRIHDYIGEELPTEDTFTLPEGLQEVRGDEGYPMLYCNAPVTLAYDIIYQPFSIHIGAGTIIEPNVVIKGPAIIGNDCQIRQAAYLRGNILVGDKCILGHATEIKSSIIMNECAAGHFNYIGDSILGSYVNLGAGTKLANLKFRSIDDKKKGDFPEISFTYNNKKVKTGVSKFGAILGDYCETGCNAVTSPAVLMGPNCQVYPNTTVPSGLYPKNSFIRPDPVKPAVGKLAKD